MNTNYDIMPATSRVWIYQADRPFNEEDLPGIREQIRAFAEEWVSHNRRLRAFGDVYFGRFVVLMVDESQAGASGCSIDKAVAFLKQLQQASGVDLFDRMRFSYMDEETVHTAGRDEFAELYRQGRIHEDTLVADTLISNKGDFDRHFFKPLRESWHRRLL